MKRQTPPARPRALFVRSLVGAAVGLACVGAQAQLRPYTITASETIGYDSNLFRTSGRGVLLIYNIMDEVEYNAQGNRVKMVKRPEAPIETQLVEPAPDDKHA